MFININIICFDDVIKVISLDFGSVIYLLVIFMKIKVKSFEKLLND